jgi:uncharacterized protein YndB with AHSA1/START domain
MARISAEIQIDATREEVWDVATDLRRTGSWVSIHRDFPDGPPGELRPGSRFRQTLKVAGSRFHVEWTATAVDGPERLAWDGEGPAGSSAHTSYTLTAADGGTRFSYENEFTLPAGKLGQVAAKAVAGQAEKQASKSLARLKAIVEA